MRELIDKQELMDFFFSDYSGTEEMIWDEIANFPLLNEENFDDAYELCRNIIQNCVNVIDSAEVILEIENDEKDFY